MYLTFNSTLVIRFAILYTLGRLYVTACLNIYLDSAKTNNSCQQQTVGIYG